MAKVTGGKKLERAMDKLAIKIRKKPSTLKVGFFEDAKYPDGTSVALVAAVNEYGRPSKGQPPRPFFRNMIAANSKQWPKQLATELKYNGCDAQAALETMGEEIAGQLQDSILALHSPPLAQSTIDRKGFDKPLIEHSDMINSVHHKVEKG